MNPQEAREILQNNNIVIGPDDPRSPETIALTFQTMASPALQEHVEVIPVKQQKRQGINRQTTDGERRPYFA